MTADTPQRGGTVAGELERVLRADLRPVLVRGVGAMSPSDRAIFSGGPRAAAKLLPPPSSQ